VRDADHGEGMRRVLRIAWNGATVLSLVACTAMGILVFSPPTSIPLTFRAGETYFIANGNAGLRFVRQAAFPATASKYTPITSELDLVRVSQPSGEALPGFKLGRGGATDDRAALRWERRTTGWHMSPGTLGGVGRPSPASLLIFDYGSVFVPYWLAIVASVALVLLRRLARRTVPRAGLCPRCGYDLRATPDRCPECGTIPTSATA